MLERVKYYVDELSNKLNKQFNSIFKKFEDFKYKLKEVLTNIDYNIKNTKQAIINYSNAILEGFNKLIQNANNDINFARKQLKIFDPIRQLKLGYSIISLNGKIIKRTKQVKKNEVVDIQVSDGKIKAKVE